MDLGLRDRLCVVTGASRGIGRATAVALSAEGAAVLLVGRSEDALAAVAAACGSRTTAVVVDVTDADAPERILDAAGGDIDVLVNNAGIGGVTPPERLTDADWQRQWEINVLAPMRLMRAFAPPMAERGWGRIVNVASSSGKRPSKTNMAYSVAKAAELSLSRAFADEYAARGVLVNAVAPGPVGSPMWLAPGGMGDQLAELEGQSREESLAGRAARVPIGRFGHEQEIAAVIAFLCSEQASYVAGAAWSADGGTVAVII